MRIMKWKDAVQEYGTFLYTKKEYKDSNECSRDVSINYNTSSGRLCTEPFPSTTPEKDFMIVDYEVWQEDIELYGEGKSTMLVSSLETTGDVLGIGEEEDLIIVYDNADINVWINKLQELKR